METNRRRFLKWSSVAAFIGLAGCAEEAGVGTQNPNVNDGPNTGNEKTDSDGGTTTFEFEETAVFTGGDGVELAMTPTGAQLQDALLYARANSIYSEVPEAADQTYLTIDMSVENTGSETARVPSGIAFISGGSQYDPKYTSAYSDTQYQSYREIQPGAEQTAKLVFSIPPTNADGSLLAEFSTFGDSAVAEWNLSIEGLSRETFDYSGLSTGEEASLSTGNVGYSMTAVDAQETRSYTYSTSGYEYEQTAGEGNKYVLVTVEAENTGDSTISVPGTYSLSLISDSSQFDTGFYRMSDEAYEGGEISPGIVRRGIVQFEVPQSASSYELSAALTQDLRATWTL